MKVLEMGVTGMGRPHRYAVISSAENLAGWTSTGISPGV